LKSAEVQQGEEVDLHHIVDFVEGRLAGLEEDSQVVLAGDPV
jgi:hypothetical protein